jgi:hypothetical protein
MKMGTGEKEHDKIYDNELCMKYVENKCKNERESGI